MHHPSDHIKNKVYHVEILPPKQESTKLLADLDTFKEKYLRVLQSGYCACITDNAMGLMAFQGHEIIEEMELPVHPNQVMIHLNTFHTKADLDNILKSCARLGIESLLIITGDGSDRLPKLQPSDIDEHDIEAVTSVELIRYIKRTYPNTFVLGVAFNPYEPPDHEFAKMKRKIEAGACFIVTQPIIEQNAQVDRLLAEYPDIPVTVEAWMSKKLNLLSDAIGYEIKDDVQYDPIATLKMLHQIYPQCGVYLSLVGFKTQYDLIKDLWI
jgi:methylenetetrahydrofolate reductase (NADPH)